MDNVMQIVYAADQTFAWILGVSLVSLLENNRDTEIRIHILDCGIGEKDRKRIEEVCAKYNSHPLHWIPATDISKETDMNVIADRGSMAQFARLFVSRHLGEETDRLLYLDSDTIIRKPLKSLWEMNLEDKTIAAMADAFSKHYRYNLGLQPEDVIFNSGIMLINLKKWKEQRAEDRILEFIQKRHGFVEKGDQGALNAVLSRDCLCFDPVFNVVSIFFDFSYEEMLRYRRPPKYYTESEIVKAREDPAIIHYTVSFLSKRPWNTCCGHPWADEWLKYKRMSPWTETPLTEEHRSWRVKIMRRLPRPLMMWLASLLQVYGRPWLYRIRLRKLDAEYAGRQG